MTKAIRWDAATLAAHLAKAGSSKAVTQAVKALKQPKYRNKTAVVAGVKFDSKAECKRWQQLCMMQKAGAISNLRRQVYFVLAPAVDLGEARKKPALRYQADHVYVCDGAEVVEDVKSEVTRKTAEYRIKKHLMATVHGILIKEVTK